MKPHTNVCAGAVMRRRTFTCGVASVIGWAWCKGLAAGLSDGGGAVKEKGKEGTGML